MGENSSNECTVLRFSVDKRSVRDHMGILVNKHKRKVRAEEKASGIAPDEPSEMENLLDTIIALEESSEAESQELRAGSDCRIPGPLVMALNSCSRSAVVHKYLSLR